MDGCLLGPPRFTAVPMTPAARAFLIDRRYRSREGGIRASVRGAPLPRPGQKSSYSFLSTKNWRTRDAVDDDVRKSLGKLFSRAGRARGNNKPHAGRLFVAKRVVSEETG